jgi:predicted nucleic acid-binding protein
MLVVDASAVTELLLGRPGAAGVEDHLRDHDFDLHAPHLLDVEVVSALRRVVASGAAAPTRADAAIADFLDLPIERYPHEVLVTRIWQLRDTFSAYDATYVALAESLTEEGAPLLSADARLARAAQESTVISVLLVG